MVLRALLLAALLTLVPVGIGVVVADDSSPEAGPVAAYRSTPLSDFDSSATVVQRAPFCERVHADAVQEALGAEGEAKAYGNGEQTEALPGGADVSHEYGCRWTAGTSEARGWVFAPPVTAAKAAALVQTAAATGCQVQQDAEAYGDPSVAVVCTAGDRATASWRGLFGDAWLSCSLTRPAGVPTQQLLAAAGRWCVAVAEAASS